MLSGMRADTPLAKSSPSWSSAALGRTSRLLHPCWGVLQAPAGAHKVGGGVRLQLSSPLGENQCCPGGHPLPYHAAGHLCGWASSRVSEERHKALHSRECRRNIRRCHQRGPPLDEGRQLPWHHHWAAASSPQPRQSPLAGNANRRALNGDRQLEAAAPTPEPLQSLTQPGQRGWSTTWQKACDQWPTHPWMLVVPTAWPRWSSMPVQAAVPAATAWPARRTATGKLLTPVASIRRARRRDWSDWSGTRRDWSASVQRPRYSWVDKRLQRYSTLAAKSARSQRRGQQPICRTAHCSKPF